jgi:hypothetical protein
MDINKIKFATPVKRFNSPPRLRLLSESCIAKLQRQVHLEAW